MSETNLRNANAIINQCWKIIKKYNGDKLSPEQYEKLLDETEELGKTYKGSEKLLFDGMSESIYNYYESLDPTSPLGRSLNGTHTD